MQPCPVQYPDVVALEIETLCQQGTQLACAAVLLERVPQLDDAAPLADGTGSAPCVRASGHVLGVVLGRLESSLVASARGNRETLHRSPLFCKGQRVRS